MQGRDVINSNTLYYDGEKSHKRSFLLLISPSGGSIDTKNQQSRSQSLFGDSKRVCCCFHY